LDWKAFKADSMERWCLNRSLNSGFWVNKRALESELSTTSGVWYRNLEKIPLLGMNGTVIEY
jgi:hypothetical protein